MVTVLSGAALWLVVPAKGWEELGRPGGLVAIRLIPPGLRELGGVVQVDFRW
jgi:hypothetical protein